jgi:hypothetical protein
MDHLKIFQNLNTFQENVHYECERRANTENALLLFSSLTYMLSHPLSKTVKGNVCGSTVVPVAFMVVKHGSLH